MKQTKTILIASTSVLAVGMARGAIYTNIINQVTIPSESGITFDLNGDGNADYTVLFDGNNSVKPCVVGENSSGGSYPGSFPDPIPYVFNELDMDQVSPTSNDNNGVPVIALGVPISTQIDVGTNTLTIGNPGGDQHGKNEGYLYQNGETDLVGQWPSTQDTVGYVALAMVDTNAVPVTTNYGWVEIDYNGPNNTMKVIESGYQDIAGSNILAGQIRDLSNIPDIYQEPASQTISAGLTATMSVVALSVPAVTSYQWMAGKVGSGVYTNLQNEGEFSGVDTSTLTVSNALPPDQLDYVVVVANANGSVTSSPPATLTVTPIGLQGPIPPSQLIYAGYPAQFSVVNITGVPTTNQWERDGTNLLNAGAFSGVTTTNLLISSVEPAVLGTYLATASTAYGSVTSSVAPLGIVYPDGTPYEATVLADGAVDYYRLDETSGTNAWDFIGGRNGVYGSDAVLGQPGPTTATGFPGFASTNYCATFQFNDTNNFLPVLPWNLNTNTVTMTAWIYPEYNQGNAGIVFSSDLLCGIRYDAGYLNTNGVDDGNIGYSWNNDYGTWGWNSEITAPHDQWSLIALAISPTNATLYIINSSGVQTAVNNYTNPVQAFSSTEYIGTWPSGAPGVNNFNGNIDEVGIFKTTLSSNQVANLYASALGQVAPPAPTISISRVAGNIQIVWTGVALLQAPTPLGPWTTNPATSSPVIISPTSAQQFFRTH